MINPNGIKKDDLVISVAPDAAGTPFWIVASGENAEEFCGAAMSALRKADEGHSFGAVAAHPPLAVKEFGGRSLDLRGATTREEVERRLKETFAPAAARNEYAAWGDAALASEAHRTASASHKEWAHHREHSLRDAGKMRQELSRREKERAPRRALDVEPEHEVSMPGMGM